MSNDLTTQEQAALATYDAAFDGNSDGWEDFSSDDVITPFLTVLQALSPQLKKSSDKYIPEAEEGDIVNTGTNEVLPRPVKIVPVRYSHEWAEFVPRNQGGGFVGRHAYADRTIQSLINGQPFGKFHRVPGDETSNELKETYYVLCLVLDKGGDPMYPAMLGITSLKISAWKRYLTAISSLLVPTSKGRRRPPVYANCFLLDSAVKPHPKGESMVYSFSPVKDTFKASLLDPSGEVFIEAKNLAESFAAGEVKVNYDQSEDSSIGESVPEGEMLF